MADFDTAIDMLERLTGENVEDSQAIEFGKEYKGQHHITTALKILHNAGLEGTPEQQARLFQLRDKIADLNAHLKNPDFLQRVLGEEAEQIEGIQIGLPQTSFEKMIAVATVIPRIIFALALDIAILPFAAILVAAAACKVNFNPKDEDVKKEKTPILLLHGSNFNESAWIVGRQFLGKQEYGSVFSLNYDGLLTNDPNKGIDDYAREKISAEIKRIKELTGCDKVILIGHSMGGLIAGCYAEYCAEADGVNIEHVFTIASPWQGTPWIDGYWKLGLFAKENDTKRHQQMSMNGEGPKTDPNFRQNLVAKARESERQGKRKYYTFWSTVDYLVPGRSGSFTEDPRRQQAFGYLGHYAIIAWITLWLEVRSHLDKLYKPEPVRESNQHRLHIKLEPIKV